MNKKLAFPNGKDYEFLYAKYFDKGVEYIAKQISGKKVLDLCGGTGRLSQYLYDKGYDITYLDICERMCLLDKNIPRIISTVEDFAKNENEIFDSIVCMQAINYWFNTTDIEALSKHINVGGKLVFNTFVNAPIDDKTIKRYKYEDYDYEEEYVFEHNIIKHYQRVYKKEQLLDEHYTEFDYISMDVFLEKLKDHFDVNILSNQNSALFVCTKK